MTVILTDIEGTTSSISFVKDVLFPYAAEQLPAFISEHAQRDDVAPLIVAIKEAENLDSNDAVVEACLAWIAADKKQTELKALQGLIWKNGYEQGDYQAHVYDDAHAFLQAWHEQGIPLYVYSSGSIYAQKLFFGYSRFGDLTSLFQGYFDTTTGLKQEAASYEAIVSAIGVAADEILFLSDVIGELDAAQAAGMRTVHVQREEGMQSSTEHSIAKSFADIQID